MVEYLVASLVWMSVVWKVGTTVSQSVAATASQTVGQKGLQKDKQWVGCLDVPLAAEMAVEME